MKKTLASFLFALSSCLLAACGGGSSAAVGVYELDKAAFKDAMLASMDAEAKKEKAAMDMIEGMVAAINMSIELKADGSAQMTNKGVPGQPDDVETGTWKLDGSKITFDTKSKDGKAESHTAEYADGKITIETSEGAQKMRLPFKKK